MTGGLVAEIEAVAAGAAGIVERAERVAELRAKNGRRIGARSRQALVVLGEELTRLTGALEALTGAEDVDAVREEFERFRRLSGSSPER